MTLSHWARPLATAFAVGALSIVSFGSAAPLQHDAMVRDARRIANAANDVWYATHRFPQEGAVHASACTTDPHRGTPCDAGNVWSLALERTPICPATGRPYDLVSAWDGTGFDVRCGALTVWSQR